MTFFNDKKEENIKDLLSISDKTKTILDKNEKRANRVTSIVLLILSLGLFISLFFVLYTVNEEKKNNALIIILSLATFCTISGLFGLLYRKEYAWKKWLLLCTIGISLAAMNYFFGSTFQIAIILPLILSCIYCSPKFTLKVGIIFGLLFFIMEIVAISTGYFFDINIVIFKPGYVIDLTDRFTRFYYDRSQVDIPATYANYFLSYAIIEYIVYIIFFLACLLASGLTSDNLKKQAYAVEKELRLQEEINLAKDVQSNSLPINFNEIKEKCSDIDIYGMVMSSNDTSGDIYDFFLIDDKHLCFCLGSVSSKGIEAVLLMNKAKEIIEEKAKQGNSPKEIFEYLNNNIFKEGNESLFITMWLGIFDKSTNSLTYVSAGEIKPLVANYNEYKLIDDNPSSIFLGGVKDTKYKEHKIYFLRGEKIFLFTQSLIECLNIENQMYGLNKLKEYLDINIDNNVNQIIDGVQKEIETYSSNVIQSNDITMLMMEYKE